MRKSDREKMDKAYAAEDKAQAQMMKSAGVRSGAGKLEEQQVLRDYGKNLGKYLYKAKSKR